jgi:hypothetical protein
MAEKPTPTASDPSDAAAPATAPAAAATPSPEATTPRRRTVTMPVLPFAIVGGVIVALIFFGGGVAVGFAIGGHPARAGVIQPFNDGRPGPFGGQNGFGQNGGRNGPDDNGGRDGGFGVAPNGGQPGGQPGGQNGGQNGGQDTRPAPAPTPAPTNG